MTARKSLRDRLEQARRENFIDLRVTTPAFEGLYVRCRAMTPEELASSFDRNQGKDTAAEGSALDVLAATCIGVWEEVDGKGVSPVDGFTGVIDLDTMALSGDLPTFASPELAEDLGVEPSAGACVRALLAPNTGLRLLPYGDALSDFSIGANESIVRTAPGN